jgi:hypothetical protein
MAGNRMLTILGLLARQEPTGPVGNQEEEVERLKAFSAELQYRQHENLVTRLTEIHKKLNYVGKAAAGIAGVSVILALVEVDYSFDGYETSGRTLNSGISTGLHAVSTLLTLILAWTIVKFYELDYERLRIRKMAKGSGFRRSPQFYSMLCELLLFSVHCPPGCNLEFTFRQLRGKLVLSLAEVTTVVMFSRLWLLLRGARFSSRWGSLGVEDCCTEFGCHSGSLFMLKAYFQSKPFLVLSVSLLTSLACFSLMIRILERPYAIDNGSGQDYNYIWNALWMVLITMFTVGYGDFYPQTHLGRVLVVIACLWGMFLISMLVVQMARATMHTQQEGRAFTLISNIRKRRLIRHTAARAVLAALRYWRGTGNYGDILDALVSFRKTAYGDCKQLSVRTALHLFEENVTIDLEELIRLTTLLQDLEKRLEQVQINQQATAKYLADSLDHTAAVVRELEGSEVV